MNSILYRIIRRAHAVPAFLVTAFFASTMLLEGTGFGQEVANDEASAASPVASQPESEPESQPRSEASDNTSPADPRAQRFFDIFDEKARSLAITPQDIEKPFAVIEPPLFRFATEGTVFGSVFAWKDDDARLAAIGTIGVIPINNVDVQFVELHLLRPKPIEPLTIKGHPDKVWQPDVTDLKPRVVNQAPPVGGNERIRMTQMRALARKFSAVMSHNGQTNQLRLLPQPLYRYPDSTSNRDGALFAFVWDKGTDPEVLLRLEALETSEGKSEWHYQPVRFTWREVELSFGGTNVWKAGEFFARDLPRQTTPYLTGLTEVLP